MVRFRAFQDLVVAGQDPEAADIGNPHGYLLSYRWFVDAVGDNGAVYIHNSQHDSQAEAEASAQRFAENLPDVVTSDDFYFDRFAYGSPGYELNGGEEALKRFD